MGCADVHSRLKMILKIIIVIITINIIIISFCNMWSCLLWFAEILGPIILRFGMMIYLRI